MNGIEDSLRKLDADDSHQWAVLQSLGPCLDASSLLLMGYPPFLPFTLVSVCSHSLDPALDETRMGYEVGVWMWMRRPRRGIWVGMRRGY